MLKFLALVAPKNEDHAVFRDFLHLAREIAAKSDKVRPSSIYGIFLTFLLIILTYIRVENNADHQRTIFGYVLPYEIADFCTKNSKIF